MTMTSLAADHAACDRVLRDSSSSFALPIRLLPAAKRLGTTALYAFCRRADDIVDDATDADAARRSLDGFEAEAMAALAGDDVPEPTLRALADTVRRFAVPVECIREILDGVRMDLTRHTYDTYAELESYCRCVATAVGVAAVHIWGYTDPAAIATSHECGMAFQLTNILRDIPEDLARGRIYLPQDELRGCGCSAEELRAGRIGPGFAAFAARMTGRTAGHFAQAAALDRMLSTDGRLVWRAMFGVYGSVFRAVRRAGTAIFTRRVRPGRTAALAAGAATVLIGPRHLRWRRP
jgi:phytoene synthase